LFLLAIVFSRCMLLLQKADRLSWTTWQMHRRLTRIFENETAFAVGVICLGFFPVAMVLIMLFAM
jgi:hypothetical protein